MTTVEEIRDYWDEDAATYDDSPHHRPTSAVVRASWTAALARLLPPSPASVLDCGAGTGFLSLIAARLGHRVTALDLSPRMLERLRHAAAADGLAVEAVVGPADEPPSGTFDAVMERHLLWTLPEPAGALEAWRAVAPAGRLVLMESVWGAVDPVERWRARARNELHRLRGGAPHHHADYDEQLRRTLPLGTGTPPGRLVDLAAAACWANPRVERLRDIEWAERQELTPVERLLGVAPRLAVSAD